MLHKTVAWIKDEYLPLSETFIYEPLVRMQKWRPIVLSESIRNRESFPYKDIRAFMPYLGMRRPSRMVRQFLGYNRFLRDSCIERNARVLHAHFGPSGVAAIPVAKDLDLPLITTFYGYDMSAFAMDPKWAEKYVKLFSEGALFLVEGPYMKQELANIGCPESKIELVHIGIDPTNYHFKPRAIKQGERLRILVAGRFVEKKGIVYAVRAAERLAKAGLDFDLRLAGDGPLRTEIERAVADCKLEGSITILGFMSHGELREEIYSAHIGMVPSVVAADGDSEGGAPKTLLEMEATGLPIVASRHADIPYVTLEGKSAFLVDEKDVEGLAEAVLRLHEAKDSWPDMGMAGSEFVRAKFALEGVVERYEKLYDQLFEG